MDHIKLYLTESSHYSRSRNPHRRYLSSVLTINKMHEQYKVWCTENNFIPVCASMYRNIFNTEFNLGFGSPRTDTCAKCDAGTAADDHKQMADAGFRSMAEDRKKARESDDIHYITFDLQKTLFLPKRSISISFYLRQLWLYNLGIHYIHGSTEPAYLQIWMENKALRLCKMRLAAHCWFFLMSKTFLGAIWSPGQIHAVVKIKISSYLHYGSTSSKPSVLYLLNTNSRCQDIPS